MLDTGLRKEHVELIAECLAPFNDVYFYTSDPGATAALLPFQRVAVEMGAFREWYVEGWARLASLDSKQSFSIDVLPKCTSRNFAVFMGQQVDFGRAYQRIVDFRSVGAEIHFVSDHWKDISLSFKPDGGKEYVFPDRFYVPDSGAFDRQKCWLNKLGIPSDIVQESMVEFFHPGVERSLQLISGYATEAYKALREKYEVHPYLITMMLDCTTAHEERVYGFGWKTSLYSAVKFFEKHYYNATLLVKPHPRQEKGEVLEFVRSMSNPNVKMVEENGPERFVGASDEIWGATTVLLVVAIKFGKKIKVFMPNRTPEGAIESNVHIEPYLVVG